MKQKTKTRMQAGGSASRVRAEKGSLLLSVMVLIGFVAAQASLLDNPESPEVSLYRMGCRRKEALSVDDKLEAWRFDLGGRWCGANYRKVLVEVRAEQDRLMESALRPGRNGHKTMELLMWFEDKVIGSLERKQALPECKQAFR
jgi:hypothetical protein